MNPVFVDSHCHLNLLDFDKLGKTLDEVVNLTHEQGVKYLLCVSIDMASQADVLTAAKTYDHVFASVGVHPNTQQQEQPSCDELLSLAKNPKVIAIGETGLDYYRGEGDLEWQRQRFRCHIEAALHSKKPLIIHCRDAKEDTLRILAEEGAQEVGGVMHCFVEDWETAKAAIDLNFYISFSGIVTFKTAESLRDVARRMPQDRILIETDSPYLAPMPFRGKTNQPAYVRHVAEKIAEVRNEPLEVIAQQTTDNFFTLFKDATR